MSQKPQWKDVVELRDGSIGRVVDFLEDDELVCVAVKDLQDGSMKKMWVPMEDVKQILPKQ
jgi:hypothetical protein